MLVPSTIDDLFRGDPPRRRADPRNLRVAAAASPRPRPSAGTHYEGNTFEDLFGDNGEAGGRAKCQAFSCKEGKQAVPARLSLKVKSGGCDALTSGAAPERANTPRRRRDRSNTPRRRRDRSPRRSDDPVVQTIRPRPRRRRDARTPPAGSMSMFTAKQDSAQTPADACCDRRQACDQICGTSERFCDAELKTCINSACDADDDARAGRAASAMLRPSRGREQQRCKNHRGQSSEFGRARIPSRRRPPWRNIHAAAAASFASAD